MGYVLFKHGYSLGTFWDIEISLSVCMGYAWGRINGFKSCRKCMAYALFTHGYSLGNLGNQYTCKYMHGLCMAQK